MTQTRKEALTDLLAKVEVNEAPHWRAAARAIRLHPDGRHLHVIDAFDGSIDAAKALHEAALPGYDFILTNSGEHADAPFGPLAAVAERAAIERGEAPLEGSADTIARAWLIAILKALIAQEPDQ